MPLWMVLLGPNRRRFHLPVQTAEKNELLEAIVTDLNSKNKIKDFDQALRHVIERENVMSTGIGNGVAIPHAYTDGVDKLVAGFYRTGSAVEFSSLDGEPVDLIFVILGPKESRRDHIKWVRRPKWNVTEKK